MTHCLDLIYPPSKLHRLITDLQKLSASEKRLIERDRDREREGFQAVFHWIRTVLCHLYHLELVSRIKQSPALWFCMAVWVHLCFSPENCVFSPMFTPLPQKCWHDVPAFMFLRFVVSSTRARGDIRKGCYAQLFVPLSHFVQLDKVINGGIFSGQGLLLTSSRHKWVMQHLSI